MKIGIVSNLYPPHIRGGAEQVVVRTVEGLTEAGHNVFIVTAAPRGTKGLERSEQAPERIYRFFPGNLYFVLDDYLYPWPLRFFWHIYDTFCGTGKRHMKQVIDEENPDVIMTHNLKGIGLRIPRAIQRANVTHVHVVHDLQLIYPSGLLFVGKERVMFFLTPLYLAYARICEFMMGKPDLVIFPSTYLRNEYLRRGFFRNSRVEVIPNPAPLLATIERSGRHPGPLNLLFVGQLEEHKGIRFLLNTFEDLDIPANLIIAGEGTLRPLVEKKSKERKNINYLGYISLDQLANCFNVADALVVPSLCYENSPTVIYETLQSGVPVLASNIGGVGELVEDSLNGFLFTAGSRQDLMRVIKKLDERKETLASFRDEIKGTVSAHSLPIYTKRLLLLIAEVKGGAKK